MEFTKYADDRYRAVATDPESGKKALFSTKEHPAEVDAWEQSGVVTETGLPVLVPKTETVEVEVDMVKVHKQRQQQEQEIKMDWS